MAEFLVELYVSRTDTAAATRGAERLGRAAAQLTGEGMPVQHLRSIFVPEDETCFLLFEAVSAEAVREVSRRCALPFERVAGAITTKEERR